MPVEIAVSVLTAEELVGCETMEIRDIHSQEELDEAVSGGHLIYQRQEEGPPKEIFDGHEWLIDERPVPEQLPNVDLPTTPYVVQRFDLMQAQIDALTEALLEVDPENSLALKVRESAVDARAAMAFDDEANMDQLIGSLRETREKKEA